MAQNNELKNELIDGLMNDIGVDDGSLMVSKDDIEDTIGNILKQYNLSTDKSFIEKIATLKMDQGESITIADMPQDLQDAAFLPVNTIADIAIKHDIDLIISQLPEYYSSIQITRDTICEADVSSGTLARDIKFETHDVQNSKMEHIMDKIKKVEEKLELHAILKDHCYTEALEYGEGYLYAIPFAKVFDDLQKYRLTDNNNRKNPKSDNNLFNSSNILRGYGYGESAEISLHDTIVMESDAAKNKNANVFTESEVQEFSPLYHKYDNNIPEDIIEKRKSEDEKMDAILEQITHNIRYIENDIAVPVIEESAHDLLALYEARYKESSPECVQEVKTFFETTMDNGGVDPSFQNIQGIYLRPLPSTKVIPIRIDREIVGYYYISDLTRPEETGDRKNSGLSGYTLRSPSLGYDTFKPDQMFCDRLANKIINNFNIKFMRNNTALHQQIVAILQSHKFNDAMMRFIFIPAEHVIPFVINKDGSGKGHSILEPGLVTARMYMFLKLYSILYQINNSQVRIYNVRWSGMDKNYKKLIQETIRKFAQRRITANDIFNYRDGMNKVNGCSELVMPVGTADKAPITFETLDPVQAPINTDLMNELKNEAINSQPVPSLYIRSGEQSEVEFAKENELADTKFNTYISSIKLNLNPPSTRLYRKILRWETDIEPDILMDLQFVLRVPNAKTLNVTIEMVNNFNSLCDILIPIFLSGRETKSKDDIPTDVVREFKKLLLHESIPQIDISHTEELANLARENANKLKLAATKKSENLVDDELQEEV